MPTQATSRSNRCTPFEAWFQAVAKAFGLDEATFLMAGTLSSIGTLCRDFWAYFDSIPAMAPPHRYEPTFNSFSDAYGSVVNLIVPNSGTAWRDAVGDYYASWAEFLKTRNSLPPGGMGALFREWALASIPDRRRAENAIAAYSRLQEATIPAAQARFIAAAGKYGYSLGIQEAKKLVDQDAGCRFEFDCDSIEERSRLDPAPGFGNFLEDWMGLRRLDQRHRAQARIVLAKFLESRVEGCARFDHKAAVGALPLQDGSLVCGGDHPAWFSRDALEVAFRTTGAPRWPKGMKPNWEQTFGASGTLRRLVTSVVLIDGMKMKLVGEGDFKSEDIDVLRQLGLAGITPLFSFAPAAAPSIAVSGSDGRIEIEIESPPGSILALGVVAPTIGEILEP